jgi:dynein heavy chain
METPQMFGMHPNAEIGYLTAHCDTVFETILEVSGGGSGGAKASGEDTSKVLLADF